MVNEKFSKRVHCRYIFRSKCNIIVKSFDHININEFFLIIQSVDGILKRFIPATEDPNIDYTFNDASQITTINQEEQNEIPINDGSNQENTTNDHEKQKENEVPNIDGMNQR